MEYWHSVYCGKSSQNIRCWCRRRFSRPPMSWPLVSGSRGREAVDGGSEEGTGRSICWVGCLLASTEVLQNLVVVVVVVISLRQDRSHAVSLTSLEITVYTKLASNPPTWLWPPSARIEGVNCHILLVYISSMVLRPINTIGSISPSRFACYYLIAFCCIAVLYGVSHWPVNGVLSSKFWLLGIKPSRTSEHALSPVQVARIAGCYGKLRF